MTRVNPRRINEVIFNEFDEKTNLFRINKNKPMKANHKTIRVLIFTIRDDFIF